MSYATRRETEAYLPKIQLGEKILMPQERLNTGLPSYQAYINKAHEKDPYSDAYRIKNLQYYPKRKEA